MPGMAASRGHRERPEQWAGALPNSRHRPLLCVWQWRVRLPPAFFPPTPARAPTNGPLMTPMLPRPEVMTSAWVGSQMASMIPTVTHAAICLSSLVTAPQGPTAAELGSCQGRLGGNQEG